MCRGKKGSRWRSETRARDELYRGGEITGCRMRGGTGAGKVVVWAGEAEAGLGKGPGWGKGAPVRVERKPGRGRCETQGAGAGEPKDQDRGKGRVRIPTLGRGGGQNRDGGSCLPGGAGEGEQGGPGPSGAGDAGDGNCRRGPSTAPRRWLTAALRPSPEDRPGRPPSLHWHLDAEYRAFPRSAGAVPGPSVFTDVGPRSSLFLA